MDAFKLDFEKAFNTPPHELLKSNMFCYGIVGTTLKWINSLLCYRHKRVVVNEMKSDWTPISLDVSQGIVHGPLLFSLYINNLSTYLEFEIRRFC